MTLLPNNNANYIYPRRTHPCAPVPACQVRVILDALAQRAAGVAGPGAGEGGGLPGTNAGGPCRVPVVFVGDFNAAPGSGLYRYVAGGRLDLRAEDRRELSGEGARVGVPRAACRRVGPYATCGVPRREVRSQ